jgi:RHS repeat-associated protein
MGMMGFQTGAETGLDYFGARYMSSAQGRFTSPDAPFADQHPADPQSWNLYSYARNNPLRYGDPTGRAVCSYGSGSAPDGGPATTEKACTEGGGTWVYQPTDTDDPNADASAFRFSVTKTENTGELSANGQAVVNQLGENADSSMALIATVAGGSVAAGAVAGVLPALAPETLYHFTTQAAKQAIVNSGQLIPTVGITGLGVYGTAVRNAVTVAWAGVPTQAVVTFSPGLSQVRPGLIPFLWWSVRPAVTTLFQYGVPIRR